MTAHCPPNPFTLQPGYLQSKTDPGKDPAALSHTHTVVDLDVFWQSRKQVLDGKVHGEKAYNSLVSTPTGPIPPTHTPCTFTTTTSLITTMTCSYTYEEQVLRDLQSHARWNARIMWKINTIHNTFPEDLSELYELYGLLIWPYTIEEIVHHLWTPLIIFPNTPEAIPTLAEWQPQPEAPDPFLVPPSIAPPLVLGLPVVLADGESPYLPLAIGLRHSPK
jgi:hypothetical protein